LLGHETTSGLLSFATYYLIHNPEVLQKAQEEVDRVIGQGAITYQHMSQLPYIEAILRESLRLNPTASAWAVKPVSGTQGPVLIADGKYEVPADATFVMVLPGVGRDPEAFGPDAEEFNPDRMFGENFAKIPPNCWKPFG
jgi:cytochrome P450 / NADPH-cytochrome P450 reductase